MGVGGGSDFGGGGGASFSIPIVGGNSDGPKNFDLTGGAPAPAPAAAPADTAPPPPVDAESQDAKNAQAAAREDEARKAKLRAGRKSTILTGALGLSNSATVAKKTLLGQ
jgi:hypothetical protein